MEISDTEVARRRRDLNELMGVMASTVALDGGDLRLVDVDVVAGVVNVELSGSCESCSISTLTLDEGVKRILLARLDWVTEVHGVVADELGFDASAATGAGGWRPAAR